jgi:hypothetical protein
MASLIQSANPKRQFVKRLQDCDMVFTASLIVADNVAMVQTAVVLVAG